MRSSTTPRIAHDATVTVEGEAHHPFAARAVNLSVGGMFVETETLLPPGAQVALKVELRDGGATVDAQGEVVWVRDGVGEPPGMALRFVGLDETSTRRIGRVVAAGRREPSALFKRDVRIRLAALPAPLRAVARDQSEEGLILEAELPWLKLGSEVTAELGPSSTRSGRVRWVGLDITRAGAARLRILVDLDERSGGAPERAPRLVDLDERAGVAPGSAPRLSVAAPEPARDAAAPSVPLSLGPTVRAPMAAPFEAPAEKSPRKRSRLLRNLILALLLIAPALIALWLTTSSHPTPTLLQPSAVPHPAAAVSPPSRVEVPKAAPEPAEEATPPPRHHRRHHR